MAVIHDLHDSLETLSRASAVPELAVDWWSQSALTLLTFAAVMRDFDDTSHLVTHLAWPHQPENPPGRPRAWRISP